VGIRDGPHPTPKRNPAWPALVAKGTQWSRDSPGQHRL